jgi:hypothetical protein
VTVYDPEKGLIEIDISLPIPLKDLQQMPDLQTYVNSAQNLVDDYLPAKDTVMDMYNKVRTTVLRCCKKKFKQSISVFSLSDEHVTTKAFA